MKQKKNSRITYKLVKTSMLKLKPGDMFVLQEDSGEIVSCAGVQVYEAAAKATVIKNGVHCIDANNMPLHKYD